VTCAEGGLSHRPSSQHIPRDGSGSDNTSSPFSASGPPQQEGFPIPPPPTWKAFLSPTSAPTQRKKGKPPQVKPTAGKPGYNLPLKGARSSPEAEREGGARGGSGRAGTVGRETARGRLRAAPVDPHALRRLGQESRAGRKPRWRPGRGIQHLRGPNQAVNLIPGAATRKRRRREPNASREEPQRRVVGLAEEQHVLLQAGGQGQLLHRLRQEPHAQAAAHGVTRQRL